MRLVLLAAVLVFAAARVAADSPTLPSCRAGQMVTAGPRGLVCASLDELLRAEGCEGVLAFTRSEGLKCLQPGTTPWNVELVLPRCDAGAVLKSEGFGRWKCVEAEGALPSCDRGEGLVSEGSGRWRCNDGLPQCSSGDGLVSEGFGRWRCARPSR